MKSSILEENLDENYEPTTQEIQEYAKFLGMDPDKDKELLWIARESLKAPLPENWKPCQTEDGDIYYFNFKTGESLWDHPCDAHYKELFQQKKAELAKTEIESRHKKISSLGSLPVLSSASNISTISTKAMDQEEKKIAGLLKLKTNNSFSALGPIKKSLDSLPLEKPKLEQLKLRDSQTLDLEVLKQANVKEKNRLNVELDKEVKEYEKEIREKIEREKKRIEKEYLLQLDEEKKKYEHLIQDAADKNERQLKEETDKMQQLITREKERNQKLIQEENDKWQKIIQEEGEKNYKLLQEERDRCQRLIQEEKEKSDKLIQEEKEKSDKLIQEEKEKNMTIRDGLTQRTASEEKKEVKYKEIESREIKMPQNKSGKISFTGQESTSNEHNIVKFVTESGNNDDSFVELVKKCNQILDDGNVYSNNLTEISQKKSTDDDFIQHLKDKLSHYRDKTMVLETNDQTHDTRPHPDSKIAMIESNDSKILEYLQKVKERNFLEASALSRHVLPDQIRRKTSYIAERSKWLAECQEQEEFLRKF